MREKEFAIVHVVLSDFSNVFTNLKNETGTFKKKSFLVVRYDNS